jgi:osmotically-inducible protein OsmY
VATRVSIETEVLQALCADPRLPHPEEIAVAVDDEAVTLRGTVGSFIRRRVTDGPVTPRGLVSWQFESDAAYEDVANLLGVIGIPNEIRVINP